MKAARHHWISEHRVRLRISEGHYGCGMSDRSSPGTTRGRNARKRGTAVMGFRPPPMRHWRSYGTEPLPTVAEALDQPLRVFPGWFLRVECERCGKVTMINEAPMSERRRGLALRVLISLIHHDSPCGGRAGRVELLSGIEGASSRPVRRIVLRAGPDVTSASRGR
jgi:hypothetical protein